MNDIIKEPIIIQEPFDYFVQFKGTKEEFEKMYTKKVRDCLKKINKDYPGFFKLIFVDDDQYDSTNRRPIAGKTAKKRK